MEVLIALLCVCVGFMFGFAVSKRVSREEPIGVLRIDNSDPVDGPYLFLELEPTANPMALKHRKRVTLTIKAENFISHD